MMFVSCPGNDHSLPLPPPKDDLSNQSASTHPGPSPSHPGHSPSHSGPAPLPSSESSPFPTDDDDLLSGDLGALYSAIDDIFDATIRNSTEVAPGLDDAKATPPRSPPRERKDASNMHTVIAIADSALVHQAPKPFPRTRSQTKLKPSTGEQSSQEVNGHGHEMRIMGIEELSKNYSKLQLELQELRKEVEISRELDGE